jgi:hypothetical protein
MNKTAMKTLVDRFLTWPVPADVHPDGEPGKPGRTGTNLLNAVQAEQMLRYVLTADKPETDARKPYNIDADPDGIRALVCDAVRGALSFGFQGVNPPPEGHWLGEFWRMAQTSAQDPWSPSRESSDYDHSIHSNPDATAWAAFFVRTFPGLKDKEDLMVSWFANAMMAMHDHVKAQPAALVAEVADLQKQLEDTKQSLAFYKGRCDALQACQSTMRDPERTMVCDILANGSLLMDGKGQIAAERYAAAPVVQDGWKLVPVEPTREMCKAAVVFANGNAVYKNVAAEALKIEEGIYGEAYAAMLAAAPQPEPAQALRGEQG